ncbi:MAG: hypothetical protein JW795_23670, partial [Chitinivibrionales bacterium]|nr:hypothetical protein [Chitinivibrionales bacterium]
ATSSILLSLYGFNPSTVSEQQYKQFLTMLFGHMKRHLRLCNAEIIDIFSLETQLRIDSTTKCLKTRLEME